MSESLKERALAAAAESKAKLQQQFSETFASVRQTRIDQFRKDLRDYFGLGEVATYSIINPPAGTYVEPRDFDIIFKHEGLTLHHRPAWYANYTNHPSHFRLEAHRCPECEAITYRGDEIRGLLELGYALQSEPGKEQHAEDCSLAPSAPSQKIPMLPSTLGDRLHAILEELIDGHVDAYHQGV